MQNHTVRGIHEPAERQRIQALESGSLLARATMRQRRVKRLARRCLQQVAARFGPHTRRQRSPRLLVLMYHRILPPGDQRTRFEEPGMLVTPESFSMHLEILGRYFDFTSLSQWIENRSKGVQLAPMACAITFDDGWMDNYEFAYPLLKKHSVPATIFLVSDMIGTSRRFWPERLARLVVTTARKRSRYRHHPALSWIRELSASNRAHDTDPTPEELSEVIARAKNTTDREINDRLDFIERELGLDGSTARTPALLSWTQVSEMMDSGLIEPGSHTCNHTRLNAGLARKLLENEIIQSKQTIEKQTGRPAGIFCFPNGDYTPEALGLVKRHYTGAVTTVKGWNSVTVDNYLLRRIGIHEDIAASRSAFLARVSGWL